MCFQGIFLRGYRIFGFKEVYGEVGKEEGRESI